MSNAQSQIKQIGSKLSLDSAAARDHSPGAQPPPGQTWREAQVIDGDVANGYTVSLLDPAGVATSVQFVRVHTFPPGGSYGGGDYVMLMFDNAQHPRIIALGGGGEGGAADYVIAGESWFVS